MVVYDYGYKLFNCIPLFRSDITMERVQKEMAAYAAKRGKQMDGLVYHRYDTVMFNMPLLAITIPIPYVFCYHEVQLSGVLK